MEISKWLVLVTGGAIRMSNPSCTAHANTFLNLDFRPKKAFQLADRDPTMLNDSTMRNTDGSPSGGAERRGAARQNITCEAVVEWHFSPETPIRYLAMDMSETGLRIRSSTPLLEGMTGNLASLLPDIGPMNRAIMVVWTRPSTEEVGSYEAGIHFF